MRSQTFYAKSATDADVFIGNTLLQGTANGTSLGKVSTNKTANDAATANAYSLFSYNNSANNSWEILPNGLIIQTGKLTFASSIPIQTTDGTTSEMYRDFPSLMVYPTFPIAFPNAVLSVVVSANDPPGGNAEGSEMVTSLYAATTVNASVMIKRIRGSSVNSAEQIVLAYTAIGY